MNGEQNFAGVFVTVDGKKIGEVQSADLSHLSNKTTALEKELKNGEDMTLFNKNYAATFSNVEISEEFLNRLIPTNQRYTVVGTGHTYPRGNKLPKKKRIRNKWIKKYQHEFVLEDCMIN